MTGRFEADIGKSDAGYARLSDVVDVEGGENLATTTAAGNATAQLRLLGSFHCEDSLRMAAGFTLPGGVTFVGQPEA